MDDKKIRAVILDWAGTAVDYGCFAPARAFREAFAQKNIQITAEEIRGPMGLPKREHIRALTRLPGVGAQWLRRYGRTPDESDVDEIYRLFEPALLKILPEYAEPLPGVVETFRALRGRGIKIGSTTGYTGGMMAILIPEAEKRGYAPDCCVTPDALPGGRPAPWMCFENAKRLGVYPMSAIVKVGDTPADIEEGRNAGCWSVGVVAGSNELGLSREEKNRMDASGLRQRCDAVGAGFMAAGAHFVIGAMSELPALIGTIDGLTARGERP